jgi:hypothetical protein
MNHRQALVELEDANGMGIGVADVFVADSMLAALGAMTGPAPTATS